MFEDVQQKTIPGGNAAADEGRPSLPGCEPTTCAIVGDKPQTSLSEYFKPHNIHSMIHNMITDEIWLKLATYVELYHMLMQLVRTMW